MMIDIHAHTARKTGVGTSRPDGSRYPTPGELLESMDANGVDKTLLMCGVSPECRYRFVIPEEVLGICEEHPDRFIASAGLDPRMLTNSTDSDFRPLLARYKDAGCRSIGEYAPNLAFDDPLNMNLFGQIEEAGLPLTFHMAPAIGGFYGCYDDLGLPRLEKVLRTFPNLILLGHSQPFWAEISADVTQENRGGYPKGPVKAGRVVELMRAYPNLHGDLSAGSGFNAISRDKDFGRGFLEEFQDRLYFGTDTANVPQEHPIIPYLHQLRDEGGISGTAFQKITSGNALRLLKLASR